jgi:HPt (histidine-containing phosphotransfer) domain-containing protein
MSFSPDLQLPLLAIERRAELSQVPHPDGSLYSVLLARIQAAWPGRWQEVQSALSGGQWERVAALTHALVGTTASLGLARLSGCLRVLERAARQADAESAGQCAAVVADLYAQTMEACLGTSGD